MTVHDFGRDGGRNYIVMEYIEGKDLKTLIKEGSPFKPDRALDIAIQICAGIGYAHRAGLVHCDVKPQNILVTPDGRVKVADFGMAKALVSLQPGETTDVVWGSPQYYSTAAAGAPPRPVTCTHRRQDVQMLAGGRRLRPRPSSAGDDAPGREPPRLTLTQSTPARNTGAVVQVLAKEPSALPHGGPTRTHPISYRGAAGGDRRAAAAGPRLMERRPWRRPRRGPRLCRAPPSTVSPSGFQRRTDGTLR